MVVEYVKTKGENAFWAEYTKIESKIYISQKIGKQCYMLHDELYSFDIPFSGCITLQHILQF